ncbi:MAG: cation:proton antiporter, partial [Nanoarchaeota archaeon]|nr:cation:proton antiporter [Nanoarchaeota archaeon]
NALETLYGKISLGFLLVQDFVAVIVLLLINSFIALSGGGETSFVFLKLFLAMLVAIGLFFITKPLLKFFFKKNHNSEVLFLFSIAWCLGIASLYDLLGFSLEIGALIAGAALASTNLHYEISARIKPLRDFFIILFFIVLGSEMFSSTIDFSEISSNSEKLSLVASELMSILPLALSLSLLVCIGNPIIVFLIMTALKYTPRIAFNAGLAVSQISEFSLIIALLAFQSGIIDSGVISLLTLVMLLTITISSYMFYHSDELYAFFSPLLKRVNKHKFNHDEKIESGLEVIISGLSRSQEHHLERIWRNFHHVTIVENNQKNYQDMKKRGFPVVFGDMSNVEFISEFDMSSIKLCISLHQDEETSIMLVENIRKINNKGVIIVSAESEAVAYQLYVKGADYVIIPNHVHHEKAFSMIEDLLTSKDKKKKLKDEHIKFLKEVLD